MSDPVSMVWVLRSKKTNEIFQLRLSFHSIRQLCIWSERQKAADFLRILHKEDDYEPCFEQLDSVANSSSHIIVDQTLTAQDAAGMAGLIAAMEDEDEES